MDTWLQIVVPGAQKTLIKARQHVLNVPASFRAPYKSYLGLVELGRS